MSIVTLFFSAVLPIAGEVAQSQNDAPPYIYVYEHADEKYEYPQEWSGYTQDFFSSISKDQRKNFIVLDDKDGRFRVLISGDAIPLFGLREAGTLFNEGAKTGQIGFDTSTELGKRALSLIRNYDPYIDESEPAKQPIVNVGINLFIKPEGGQTWGSDYYQSKDRGYYKYPGDEKILAVRNRQHKVISKGPGFFIVTPIIQPYRVLRVWKKGEYNVFDDGEYARLAQELVMKEYFDSLEIFRHGMESYATMMIDQLIGPIGNRLPGDLDLSQFPEGSRTQLEANMLANPQRFGFLSMNDAQAFIDKGGKLSIKFALEVYSSHSNPANGSSLSGVGFQLPIVEKKKK